MITQERIDEHHAECEENKKKWDDGPWQNEPHRVEWEHSGFRCLALRQPSSGHWCGYVGLPEGHEYYNHEDPFRLSYGHGGVTYGEMCSGNICHLSDGEKLYWLGFDCAHGGDYTPINHALGFRPMYEYETYKDINYVKRETNRMAEELSGGKVGGGS